MFYYYLLKYGQHVVRFVPLRVGYAVCWLIGWAVYWGQGRVRRAVLGNLRHVVPQELRRNGAAWPGGSSSTSRRIITI